MIDFRRMESAAVSLWGMLSDHPSVLFVGVGEKLIVYLRKGYPKPKLPAKWEGFEVISETISAPVP